MAQFVKTFYQELNNKKRTIRHCEDVCFTGDNLSDMIGVYLTVDGQPYTGGGTVSGTVINSRGQTIPITTGAISGNLVTATLEQAALAVPGRIGIYVKLTTGTTVTTVLAAKFTVEQTETDTPIDPGTVISSVDALIARINTAVESIPADYSELLAGVAPSFSSSTAYTAGQYVWYPGLVDNVGALYRFTADHAAGSWTGTDAAAVALANDVADLKSALYNDGDAADTWVAGTLDATNGTVANSTTRIRLSIGDPTVAGIKPTNGYSVLVYAYNLGEYVGCWSGTGFTKKIAQIKWVSNEITFAEMNVNYQYRIVAKNSAGDSININDGENILLIKNASDVYTDKTADETVDHVASTSISQTGNTWKKYRFRVGHSYIVKNTGASTVVIHTVNAIASYDYIETIGQIASGVQTTFTPTKNAEYVHVYSNGAGSYTITDKNTIEYVRTEADSKIAATNQSVSQLENTLNGEIDTVDGKITTEIATVNGRITEEINTLNNTIEQDIDDIYINNQSGSRDVAGNSWYKYKVLAGHKYKISNDSTSTGAVILATTDAIGSYTNIEVATGSGNIPVGSYIDFSATLDADYIRVYTNGAASYSIDEITTVDWLIERTKIDYVDLPSYYTHDYLDGIITKINNAVFSGYTSAFAFITDMHTAKNRNYSGRLLQYIAKHTALPFVLYGGDTVMAYANTRGLSAEDAVMKDVEIWKLYFADILAQNNVPLFNVHGNHDFTIKDSESASTGWTAPNGYTVQQVCGNRALKIHGEPGKSYYYFDDTAAHIRYIVLDEWCVNSATSGNNTIAWGVSVGADTLDVDQYTWLVNALSIDDYTIIIFAHASPDPDITDAIPTDALWTLLKLFANHGNGQYINGDNVELFNVDFRENTSELAFTMSGHWHRDTADFKDGILNIVTTCDSYVDSDSQVQRVQKTLSEQAFDYVVVDINAKTVRTIRIGGGSDRAWNYSTGEVIS